METSSDNLPTTDDATQATGMVPEAPDNAREDATPEGAPAAAAAMAARGAGAVAAGFSAMRDVRRAAKQSASARARLQAIRKQIDADQKVLDRRVDVESRYDQIVAEQTAELARASRESDQADAEATRLGRERDELKARLEALKKDNAQRLAPYKDLADAARGRTDDAAKALSEARRAVKTAEGQVADATSKRDERTASAEQALANARDRLSKLKTQLAAIETDPDQARVAAELRESIATETARVAATQGYPYFTTTLSVSPHKNAEILNQIGQAAGEKYGVKYLMADFKKKNGYLRSLQLSKEYGLYRQDYCGCLFSKPVDKPSETV